MKQTILRHWAFIIVLALMPYGSFAQLLNSCDQWANITTNGYNVYNNIWGSGAGSQCITVNAYNNWFIDANHPAGSGGIKSYPNVERQLNLNVDNMGSVTSTFAVTRPSGGSYSTAYDIWYNNYAYEVMLWMNYTGAVGPIASSYNCNGACPEASNVTIGGHTWNVYRGSNGSNAVFSFLRTSNTNSGTVDITAISQWLRSNGWFGNVNLHSVQLGFEITGTSGTQRFSVTNFNVTSGSTSNSLNVSSTNVSLGSGASSSTVNVTSNVSWSVTDNQSWITVSPTSGSNNGNITISATSNTSSSSRSGTVTVTGGGITRTINVSQSGTSGGCTPSSITPYAQVNNGSWQQTANVTVNSGTPVRFGPQPTSGGSWSWSGCGTSGSSREQTISPTSTCTATATYTNSCGAQSTQNFTVTVNGSSGGSRSVTLRARGTQSGEQIQLRAGSTTVSTFTLTTSLQNYTASTSASGNLTVHFINDNGGRDVQLDYIIVNGTTIQSESRAINTAVWQNNSCGGSNSEWLHCNGYIDFGAGTGARFAVSQDELVVLPGEEELRITASPNPFTDKLIMRFGEQMKGGNVSLINVAGKTISSDLITAAEHIMDVSDLPQGMYLIKATSKTKRATLKVIKQ